MAQRTEVRDVLTPEEVAAYLRLGRTYTHNLLISGEIPSWKEGRRRLVRRTDVVAFVERRLDAENKTRCVVDPMKQRERTAEGDL